MKMNNNNDGIPNILNISDDYTYATFYHKYFDTGEYIFQLRLESGFATVKITPLNKVQQKLLLD